jgi:putative SOS response-associated peptidase YedK
MCKRFSFKTAIEEMELQFGMRVPTDLRWSYNVAPTQHAYVILNDDPERLQYITWGLIPANSRDGRNEGKLINARKEGIGVSPSFRIPIRSRRCLILVDSFYCWQNEGTHNTPFRITQSEDQLMTLAGVWDVWYKGDYAVKSFSIITKSTTGDLRTINPRMPVVIQKNFREEWLSDISLSRVQTIMDNKDPEGYFKYYQITSEIDSIKKNDQSLHEPKSLSS